MKKGDGERCRPPKLGKGCATGMIRVTQISGQNPATMSFNVGATGV